MEAKIANDKDRRPTKHDTNSTGAYSRAANAVRDVPQKERVWWSTGHGV